jgi:hypothetical protein
MGTPGPSTVTFKSLKLELKNTKIHAHIPTVGTYGHTAACTRIVTGATTAGRIKKRLYYDCR